MISPDSLTPENLMEIISKLPPGSARRKYEGLLCEKNSTPLGVISCEEEPALYFLAEIQALRHRVPEELEEIHKAKLTFPGQRIIQEGPETPLGQGTSIKLMTRRNVK